MPASYYLDTSALGKRYVEEVGSDWVRALTAPDAGHALLTARITMAEIYSVLARRRREGSALAEACAVAAQAFTAHSDTEYRFIELDINIIGRGVICSTAIPCGLTTRCNLPQRRPPTRL